jgi:putative nucleotidyltransferase with HDIG domain
VLAVDDDAEVLQLMRTLLHGAGYEVTCEPNLQRARQALVSGSFHLVLTDLYLDDETLGFEIAEVARCLRPQVPVVLVTGRPSFATAQDAVRSQIADLVVKPIDSAQLLAVCRRTIEQWEIRRRNQELSAQNRVLAQVLPRAIETKDPTTKGHSERVVRYADTLARRCGVDAADRESLRLASLLHDVGKIGIPNSILRKEGPLTSAEREIINRHPQMGYEILAPLENSEKVRRWVYQHHERWDGKGYPEGLTGDEVELPGRILILAEVFDALSSPRSYKPAWETGKVTEFFRAQAGKHFDPELAHLVADGLDRQGARFFAAEAGTLF